MIPTREHWRIEKWAHEQGAVPAQVLRLKFDGEPAILTFTFGAVDLAPEISNISWDMFFALFDAMQLSMAFDEKTRQFTIVKVGRSSAVYPSN